MISIGSALSGWLLAWEQRQLAAEERGQWRTISLLLCAMALLLGLQNPLLYGMAPGFDASLFAAMGKMWADGDVLYRDMLDIKGPVIFLLDAVGYKLAGFPGIALFETALLAWGLNNSYRAFALLRIAPLTRLVALLGVLSLCGYRYYYGNMTEDYTLCLALIAQYPFMRLLVSERFSWRDAWLPALSFGLIVMMRLNNGAFWGAWYDALFVCWLLQGRWLDGIKLFFSALLGVAIVAIPLLLYFQWHGVLENFWFYSFAIFFMGKSYGSGFSPLVGSVGLVRTGLIVLLPTALMVLYKWYRRPQLRQPRVWAPLAWLIVSGALLGVVANSVSGHIFDHYDQLFLAFMPLPLVLLVEYVRQQWQQPDWVSKLSFISLVGTAIYLVLPHTLFDWTRFEWPMSQVVRVLGISGAVALVLVLPLWWVHHLTKVRQGVSTLVFILLLLDPIALLIYSLWTSSHTGHPFSEDTVQQITQIRAETSPDERIWVDGTMPQLYVWTDRKPASSYLFFGNVRPPFDVTERILADLQRNQPKFIVIRKRLLAQVTAPGAQLTPSQQAFYDYIFSHYAQVKPGLFKRQSSE